MQDAAALARAIGATGATVMQATPTLWQALVTDGAERRQYPQDPLAGLRMLVGGEPLTGRAGAHAASPWTDAQQSLRPDRDHDLVRRHGARRR